MDDEASNQQALIDFDIAAIIGDSVEALKAKLSQMTNKSLEDLHAAESATVKPRKGLLEAILAEQLGREPAAPSQVKKNDVLLTANEAQARRISELTAENENHNIQLTALATGLKERGLTDGGEDVVPHVLALIDGHAAKIAELTKSLDEATAPPDAPTAERCEALTRENAELRAANADLAGRLTQQAEGAPGTKRTAKRRVLKIDEKAGEPVAVVFGDSLDMLLPGLGELEFDAAAFGDAGGAPTLHRDIEIDGGAPAGEVAAVWAIDASGKAVGVSRFNVPVAVGGGRVAKFQRRSLLFIAG